MLGKLQNSTDDGERCGRISMRPRPLSDSAFYENLLAFVGKNRRLQTCILGLDQLSSSGLYLAFPKPWVIWWNTHWDSNYVELNFSSPEILKSTFAKRKTLVTWKHRSKAKLEKFGKISMFVLIWDYALSERLYKFVDMVPKTVNSFAKKSKFAISLTLQRRG